MAGSCSPGSPSTPYLCGTKDTEREKSLTNIRNATYALKNQTVQDNHPQHTSAPPGDWQASAPSPHQLYLAWPTRAEVSPTLLHQAPCPASWPSCRSRELPGGSLPGVSAQLLLLPRTFLSQLPHEAHPEPPPHQRPASPVPSPQKHPDSLSWGAPPRLSAGGYTCVLHRRILGRRAGAGPTGGAQEVLVSGLLQPWKTLRPLQPRGGSAVVHTPHRGRLGG